MAIKHALLSLLFPLPLLVFSQTTKIAEVEFIIEGHVLDQVNSKPIPYVEVRCTTNKQNNKAKTTLTDKHGHFDFSYGLAFNSDTTNLDVLLEFSHEKYIPETWEESYQTLLDIENVHTETTMSRLEE